MTCTIRRHFHKSTDQQRVGRKVSVVSKTDRRVFFAWDDNTFPDQFSILWRGSHDYTTLLQPCHLSYVPWGIQKWRMQNASDVNYFRKAQYCIWMRLCYYCIVLQYAFCCLLTVCCCFWFIIFLCMYYCWHWWDSLFVVSPISLSWGTSWALFLFCFFHVFVCTDQLVGSVQIQPQRCTAGERMVEWWVITNDASL